MFLFSLSAPSLPPTRCNVLSSSSSSSLGLFFQFSPPSTKTLARSRSPKSSAIGHQTDFSRTVHDIIDRASEDGGGSVRRNAALLSGEKPLLDSRLLLSPLWCGHLINGRGESTELRNHETCVSKGTPLHTRNVPKDQSFHHRTFVDGGGSERQNAELFIGEDTLLDRRLLFAPLQYVARSMAEGNPQRKGTAEYARAKEHHFTLKMSEKTRVATTQHFAQLRSSAGLKELGARAGERAKDRCARARAPPPSLPLSLSLSSWARSHAGLCVA